MKLFMKKVIIICIVFAVPIGLFLLGVFDDTSTINIDKGSKIYFTDVLPDKANPKIVVCIPAAFSGEDGRIIGHYSIGKGRKGKTGKDYTTIHLDNNTYFQQASLVKNHKPKTFKDSRLRFRRALCKKNEEFSIVHSTIPVTLSQFGNQLIEYDHAWNLDMGTYSYGWYKDEKGLHHLGLSSIFNRNKQTNWIIVKK